MSTGAETNRAENPPAPAPAPAPQPQGSQLSIVPVAAAVASGIGVLGFVTFAGGVVLWRRFSEMGLPGDQAVAVVPKSVLIATGAEFLAPALAFTALMVLGLVVLRVLTTPDNDPDPSRSVGRGWAAAAGGAIALIEVIISAASIGEIGTPAFGVLVGIVIASGIVVGLAFRVIKNVAAVALIAFVATGIYWLALAYDKTSHRPTVIPMAYSRAQPGEPVSVESGYLVAETSDRIWFASVTQARLNELREFPRSETDDLEIGKLTRLAYARKSADQFVVNLCDRLKALASAAAKQQHSRRASPSVPAPTLPTVPNGCSAT